MGVVHIISVGYPLSTEGDDLVVLSREVVGYVHTTLVFLASIDACPVAVIDLVTVTGIGRRPTKLGVCIEGNEDIVYMAVGRPVAVKADDIPKRRPLRFIDYLYTVINREVRELVARLSYCREVFQPANAFPPIETITRARESVSSELIALIVRT